MIGVLAGVVASLCVALYSIHTKKVLPVVSNQIWLLSFYNNVFSTLMFTPVVLFNGELEIITNYEKLSLLYFWTMMVISGVCGLAIGFVTSLQIKVRLGQLPQMNL